MKKIVDDTKYYWKEKPLILILTSAIFFRLLAVIFAKGFGMSDDHFIVIEIAQDWVSNSMNWFTDPHTDYINLIYVGFHYCLFFVFDNIFGVTDPQVKMFWVRFIHAVYSLLIILLGYKLTLKISNKENAKRVGLFLALFWIFPFLSVRNLVEVVCIPPIMAGFYYLINDDEKETKRILLSGLLFALAFTLRFQSAFFVAGIGIVFLTQKKWEQLFWFSLGFLTTISLTMGLIDFLVWGIPFKALLNYITYNLQHQYNYVTQPWYNYIILILALLIPPISIFISFGFLKGFKKYALLFWPTFIFIFFHSYFANKQERFIIPAIPLIVTLGIIGWNEYISDSQFWKNKTKWLKASWSWFWSLNLLLLVVFTFTYGKKNCVESLYYLSNKANLKSIVWDSSTSGTIFPPKFYLNRKIPIHTFYDSNSLDNSKIKLQQKTDDFPNYIVIIGNEDLSSRITQFENTFHKKLIFEIKINPSLVDDILYRLNPKHNLNQTSHIYRIE